MGQILVIRIFNIRLRDVFSVSCDYLSVSLQPFHPVLYVSPPEVDSTIFEKGGP